MTIIDRDFNIFTIEYRSQPVYVFPVKTMSVAEVAWNAEVDRLNDVLYSIEQAMNICFPDPISDQLKTAYDEALAAYNLHVYGDADVTDICPGCSISWNKCDCPF